MGAATSTYERFDLTKYKALYEEPVPIPTAIDPQWDFLNSIMGGKSLVPGSVAERMYPQTPQAAAERAKQAADEASGMMTWVLVGGAALLGVFLIGRSR